MPLSRPAAPSTSAPVHTDVTYRALVAWALMNARVGSSSINGPTPLPPGTQITSSAGQSSKVTVGLSISPVLAVMGIRSFQIRCTFTSGSDARTSYGPVRSSCCTCGNNRKPICKVMVYFS
ncbi:hypothetical protein D3C76_1147350 [compost metagenome]